jgi:GldM C-terminal domain
MFKDHVVRALSSAVFLSIILFLMAFSHKTALFSNEKAGLLSISVAADKMNVLYIGVDNPVTIAVANTSPTSVQVAGEGVVITGSEGRYNARVTQVGLVNILVTANGKTEKHPFRVKRIPDPVVGISNPYKQGNGCIMGGGENCGGSLGLYAILENFDFEAKCIIENYEVTWTREKEDPVSSFNNGSRFEGKTASMISRASPGNNYLFHNIKARCPGDAQTRTLESISLRIK